MEQQAPIFLQFAPLLLLNDLFSTLQRTQTVLPVKKPDRGPTDAGVLSGIVIELRKTPKKVPHILEGGTLNCEWYFVPPSLFYYILIL